MTALELEIKKKELIENIDSEEILDKMQKYLHKLKKGVPPCRFSVDELKAQILQGEMDAKKGLGISQKNMRKRHLPA